MFMGIREVLYVHSCMGYTYHNLLSQVTACCMSANNNAGILTTSINNVQPSAHVIIHSLTSAIVDAWQLRDRYSYIN
jgi:hypothetical protein